MNNNTEFEDSEPPTQWKDMKAQERARALRDREIELKAMRSRDLLAGNTQTDNETCGGCGCHFDSEQHAPDCANNTQTDKAREHKPDYALNDPNKFNRYPFVGKATEQRCKLELQRDEAVRMCRLIVMTSDPFYAGAISTDEALDTIKAFLAKVR